MGSAVESSASNPPISAVIFDLDGTLLNTEEVTRNVLKNFLAKYGKVQDAEKEKKRLGMTFKESSVTIVNDYELPLTQDEFIQEILPMYQGTWLLAKPLPGANRLMRHLHKHGVPYALASNSLRKNIEGKISQHEGWKENFSLILGSDQVKSGKPAPDLFLEAAKGMAMDPSCCLVIEDSIVGVKAGKAAGMNVVAVPSVEDESHSYSIADSILHSLLQFQPEQWGLPQFEDWVGDALPIETIYLTAGVFINGLFQSDADNDLPSQIWGLFIGWAKLEGQVLKAVISVGSCDSDKRIKPCLIGGDYVDKNDYKMQLLLVGYLRRSCSEGYISNGPEIVDEDKLEADAALDLPPFDLKLRESLYLGGC